jgi:YD repeat-containing protein
MGNKIKSETVYRIDHIPGEEIDLDQDAGIRQSYHEYNEAGQVVVEIAYTGDGEIADRIEYRYDESGQLLEKFIYGEDDDVLERTEVIWSDSKRIAREIIHYLDGSEDIHEFFYDERGNLSGIQVKDDEDEVEYTQKFFYEGNKVIKVEKWDGNDEVIFRQEDEYKDGTLASRSIWSDEEVKPFTIIQNFNAAGHRTEELRYDSNEQLIERNIYEEDEQRRVVRMIEENRQRKNTTEFSYDDQGNVIHQAETDLNGDLNHEVFRIYGPGGELLKTTVEMVVKPGMQKRAYTLFSRREVI